jgi:hypothetical protein
MRRGTCGTGFDFYAETGELDDEMHEQGLTLRWLLGQLWNCTDILPDDACDDLLLPSGSSYAQAVRDTYTFGPWCITYKGPPPLPEA